MNITFFSELSNGFLNAKNPLVLFPIVYTTPDNIIHLAFIYDGQNNGKAVWGSHKHAVGYIFIIGAYISATN